jgi:hypothetical protein
LNIRSYHSIKVDDKAKARYAPGGEPVIIFDIDRAKGTSRLISATETRLAPGLISSGKSNG